jgi:2-isopropylmalate synthase
MQRELGKIVNDLADQRGEEIPSDELFQVFQNEYLDRTAPIMLENFRVEAASHHDGQSTVMGVADIAVDGLRRQISGRGNGPIAAFVDALNGIGLEFDVMSYAEHSLGQGATARAVAYIEIGTSTENSCYGAAVDTDIEQASIMAVVSALNRALEGGMLAFPVDIEVLQTAGRA